MAGNYADAIAPRVPYDRNGTILMTINSSAATAIQTEATAAALNDENLAVGSLFVKQLYLVLIFPQPYDIEGIFAAVVPANFSAIAYNWIQSSTDTTNGIDGTWTQARAGASTLLTTDRTQYRVASPHLLTAAKTGIKALKFNFRVGESFNAESTLSTLHLFGKPSATSGDRLEFWHPTLDQSLNLTPAHLDWAERARAGAPATKQVRVKNLSAALTANNVAVSLTAPTDGTPAILPMHQMKLGSGAYETDNSVLIPSLAPGEISELVTIEQSIGAAAPLGVWSQRLLAEAASWT